MPTHRPDLSRVSRADLEHLTGLDRRTLRKRLAGLAPVGGDRRTVLFEARAALERIYLGGETLDLSRERARLAAAQAERVETENAVARRELVPAAEVESFMVSVFSGVQTRLLGVPSKAAPAVRVAATLAETEEVLRGFQAEALEELAEALLAAAAA